MDWLRNLRMVLRAEKIGYVLDAPLLVSPSVNASIGDQIAYQKLLVTVSLPHVSCLH